MDPDATWAEALANAWRIVHGPAAPDSAESCAEALLALDDWLRGGGFYPWAWETTSERVTELLDVDTVADEALDAARAVLDQGDEGAALVLARRVLTRNGGASGSSNAGPPPTGSPQRCHPAGGHSRTMPASRSRAASGAVIAAPPVQDSTHGGTTLVAPTERRPTKHHRRP